MPARRVAPAVVQRLDSLPVEEFLQLEEHQPRPTEGWRAALYELTGGLINPGISHGQRQREELRGLICRPLQPLDGAYKIVTTSLKGGVGKTTVAACLGLVLADVRRSDQVIAVDINPHVGTLFDRLVGQEPPATVQHYLDNLGEVEGVSNVAQYVGTAGAGLSVMAGDVQPAQGAAFAAGDYDRLLSALGHYFHLVLTDGGTGLADPAMESTFERADSIVVVANPTVDAAGHAGKTLALLDTKYKHLAGDCIAVMCCDRTAPEINSVALRKHFTKRCRAVVDLPADPHLAAGGVIDLGRLRPQTYEALLQIAALAADGS